MNEDNKKIPLPDTEGLEMKMPENSDYNPAEAEGSALNGPVILLLALMLVGVLVGMYYWFSVMQSTDSEASIPEVQRPTAEENNEPESTTAEAQADAMLTTSPSDEISAIEADLEATNLDGLDSELNAIDEEMDSDLQ